MKYSRLFFSILFMILSVSAFPQWNWKNPLPQGNRVNDVFFLNHDTGFVSGDVGTIMKTTDGGQTWNIRNIFHKNNTCLGGLSFPSSDTGFMFDCLYGNLYKTTDGGETWDSINCLWSSCMTFIDNSTGFIGNNEGILKTTDGGMTWQEITTPTGGIKRITFPDNQTGYLLSNYGVIMKSTDNGLTWVNVLTDTVAFRDMYFSSPLCGCVVGEHGTFWKTTDGGVTWNKTAFLNTSYIWSVDMFNDSIVLIHLSNSWNPYINKMMRSTDGGQTWDTLSIGCFYQMSCRNDGFGFSDNGLCTYDYGATWTEKFTTLTPMFAFEGQMLCGITDIDFVDGNTGYATGGGYVDYCDVLKTTDGGDTWVKLDSNFYNESLTTVKFITPDIGNIAGLRMYHTNDGGNTWFETKSYGSWFNSMDFYGSTGIAAGDYGRIARSADMGQSWADIPGLPGLDFTCICMPSANAFYLSGGKYCFKSTDGGQTWVKDSLLVHINDMHFLNADTGFAACDNYIYRTYDGGDNWDWVFNTTEVLTSIDFFDADTGFVASSTYWGYVFKTTDGGATWNWMKNVPLRTSVWSLEITDQYKTFIGAGNGSLIVSDNGGCITGYQDEQLWKNAPLVSYPNPSEGIINIRYETEKSGPVVISLFDINGRKIKELYNGNQTKGNHLLQTDLSGLDKGLYVYTVEADGVIRAGKVSRE